MSTPAGPTYVRRGRFAVQLDEAEATLLEFSCDPSSIVWTPSAGDQGDPLEVLCGDNVPGASAPTTWTLAITSVQRLEAANTEQDSLVLWALANDGKSATAWFQPSAAASGGKDTKIFTGPVTVVAMPIGAEVGGTAATSEIEWPSEKPTIATAWPTPPEGLVQDDVQDDEAA